MLTSGRVGLRCRMHFDAQWERLQKIAVFDGCSRVSLILTEEETAVPPECLREAGRTLYVGVYGTDAAGETVIPTVWVNCGEIREGTTPSGQPPEEAAPDLLAQMLGALAEAAAIAQSVRADADRGRFRGEQGERGDTGPDGATFTPAVSSEGVLSWSNDGGKANPASVDLVSAVIAALPSAVGEVF